MIQQISTGTLRGKSAQGFHHAFTVMLLAIAALLSSPARSAETSFYGLPNILTHDQGRVLRLSEWNGKPMILTMEYSNCRFMCTTTFSQLKELQTAADKKRIPIDFVIISLDPDHDTPEAWRQYRKTKEIERSNWYLLTGSRATTKEIAALLGIKYWSMDEDILHDFKVVRLNAKGEIEKSITEYGVEPEYLLH
ncbi:MAG: SCO family protein [Gallionella sp.]